MNIVPSRILHELASAIKSLSRHTLYYGWHIVNPFPLNFWFHSKAELIQMSKQRDSFSYLHWMAQNIIFKFLNKATIFCTNKGVISTYFIFCSVFYVIYYSKIIAVNKKPNLIMAIICVCDSKMLTDSARVNIQKYL